MMDLILDITLIMSLVLCTAVGLFFIRHFYGIMRYGVKEQFHDRVKYWRRKLGGRKRSGHTAGRE